MENSKLLVKSLLQTLLFGLQSARWVKLKAAAILFIAFDFFFYESGTGILGGGLNYVFFTIILIGISAFLHNKSVYDSVYIWSVIGMLLSSINLFYLGNDWSVAVLTLSFLSLIGSIYNNNANNILISTLQSFILLFVSPFNAVVKCIVELIGIKPGSSWTKIFPYFILPGALVSVFLILYSATNSVLHSLLTNPQYSMDWFTGFFEGERVFLWVIFFILFTVFFVTPIKETLLTFGGYKKRMIREETGSRQTTFPILGLTQEMTTANICLASLSVLLAGTIGLDLLFMVSGDYNYSAAELSKLVHSGTRIVTFTVAISAGLVILFFRGNLNFHPRNKWLIRLSKIWLGLNGLYILIVGLKDLKYIFEYGLTAKRLSVVIFLASCLALLIFSSIKIDKKWSIQYFLNRVMGAICVIVLTYSLVDHKAVIVGFAAHVQKENIDINYLYETCIHRQKLLYKHKDAIEHKSGQEVCFFKKTPSSRTYDSWKSFNYTQYNENEFYRSEAYQNLKFREVRYRY